MILFRIITESFSLAMSQLWGNKLRTFLSLLGISIGIFCIIAVLSAVDSLEKNILNGFSELGSDVVYIDKQPWTEDPGENYWKYLKRPNPTLLDYEAIQKRSDLAKLSAYCYFAGGVTMKYQDNSLEGGYMMGSTPDYVDIQGIELQEGRHFSLQEYERANDIVILGHTVKQELFGVLPAVGKEIKLFGRKFRVIGVIKEEGENLFNFIDFDEVAWTTLKTTSKFFEINRRYGSDGRSGQMLLAQVEDGHEVAELKDELTGVLRSARKIRPIEDQDFELNEISMLGDAIAPVISTMNVTGIIIGIFALIVGMISVANIMFVSVKERTSLIGVKKAIGAKSIFILTEFMMESIFLCILGGAIGILLVLSLVGGINSVQQVFILYLSPLNIFIGVVVSVLVGMLAGMIPAWIASRLDPVVAMRG